MTVASPGLYVHVPFCVTRCPYCAFCSTTRAEADADRWLDALDREATWAASGWDRFDTIHVGGGTPTALTPGQLARLFEILYARCNVALDLQVTVEGNPADIDGEMAGTLAVCGVHRLSLGAQSFDDRILEVLGRRHRAEAIGPACDLARRAGIDLLSLDLISAIPGQPLDTWLESLDRAVALEPQHISCYQLTIEEGTPFQQQGVVPVDDETAAEHFLEGAELLAQAGFEHYEVSNYALGAEHRARHNMKYWTRTPYLGLGPSAHSFDGTYRWWNTDDLDAYIAGLEAGEWAVAGRETLTGAQLTLEQIALGLRLADGFDAALLPDDPQTTRTLEQFVDQRLLMLDDNRVRPTREGLLVADGLARELCP
jgi:oxygen-independent coproporphyrinogen-3 oxidase